MARQARLDRAEMVDVDLRNTQLGSALTGYDVSMARSCPVLRLAYLDMGMGRS